MRLFSMQGRTSKNAYLWIGLYLKFSSFIVSLVVFGIEYFLKIQPIFYDEEIGFGPLLIVVFVVWSYLEIANIVRRLHDRNRTGLLLVWAVLPVLAFIYLTREESDQVFNFFENNIELVIFCSIILLFYWMWLVVEVNILRGTDGPNEYGERPYDYFVPSGTNAQGSKNNVD